MARRWDSFEHLPLASRSQAGVATGYVRYGEYETGQLHVYAPTLAAGAWLRAWWQSSADGQHWGDYLAGATLGATGVRVMASVGGIGSFCPLPVDAKRNRRRLFGDIRHEGMNHTPPGRLEAKTFGLPPGPNHVTVSHTLVGS